MFSRVVLVAALFGVALGDTQATVAKPEVASASVATDKKETQQTETQKTEASDKTETQKTEASDKTETQKTQDTKENDDDADMKALIDKLSDEGTQQEFANKLISKMMLKLTGETTETKDTKDEKETNDSADADDADMKALLDKLSDDDVQQEFANKLVQKLSDKLFSSDMMTEPETKDTQAAQEYDGDDADMKELLDKLNDEGTQQEFAEKLVQKLTDKLSSLEMIKEPDQSDELKEEEMKELLEHLQDEDVQKEFATKLVTKLADRLFSTAMMASAFQPLDLFDYDDADTDDARVLSDQDAKDLAAEFAQHLNARGLSEEDEQDDEEQDDDEQNAADEELIEQPEGSDWFALCTPGTLAGAALFGVAMAFVVNFVTIFIERKRRSMELPTTLLG